MKDTLARLPLGEARSTLILVDRSTDEIRRGTGNLDNVKVLSTGYVNMRDVFKFERLLVTREAVDEIHRLWEVARAFEIVRVDGIDRRSSGLNEQRLMSQPLETCEP